MWTEINKLFFCDRFICCCETGSGFHNNWNKSTSSRSKFTRFRLPWENSQVSFLQRENKLDKLSYLHTIEWHTSVLGESVCLMTMMRLISSDRCMSASLVSPHFGDLVLRKCVNREQVGKREIKGRKGFLQCGGDTPDTYTRRRQGGGPARHQIMREKHLWSRQVSSWTCWCL